MEPDLEKLAAWLAGDQPLADHPFAMWYRHFAEKLRDMAPRIENGFQSKPPRSIPAPQIGRNDLCPCGSGKKFKQCHIDQAEQVAWKLGPPTPAIRASAVATLIHNMPPQELEKVPLNKASELALTEMAAVWHQHERLDNALVALKTALDGPRDDPHLLFDYWIARYAEWLVEADRAKEAEEFLLDEYDDRHAIEPWQAAQKLAAFYIDQGDPDNGETWVDTAIEGAPDNPFNHYLKGLLHHTLDQYEQATASYEKAQSLSHHFREQEQQYMEQLLADALDRARNQRSLDDDEEEPAAEADETAPPVSN
ncbi:MAG: SEC-C domain-containing protein [Magnetococcales bacterium]|nr:SEC-C domain-containing protein [Magnetococcales bacterium]